MPITDRPQKPMKLYEWLNLKLSRPVYCLIIAVWRYLGGTVIQCISGNTHRSTICSSTRRTIVSDHDNSPSNDKYLLVTTGKECGLCHQLQFCNMKAHIPVACKDAQQMTGIRRAPNISKLEKITRNTLAHKEAPSLQCICLLWTTHPKLHKSQS